MFGRIDRLRLRAQHDVVHDVLVRPALGVRENFVEHAGLENLALGEIDADGAQIVGEAEQLLLRRMFVDAIDERRLLVFQRFGRGDVCQHHELLDELHGFQPLAIGDGFHLAVFAQNDPPLGQIEVERIALLPLYRQRLVAGPERGESRFCDVGHLLRPDVPSNACCARE